MESNCLKRALEVAGCDVKENAWEDAADLDDYLEDYLETVPEDCSLLFICLMSHGSAGKLCGVRGSEMSVNQILNRIKYQLHRSIPVVSLL